ncbi:response regulator transcription factor [Pseudonocardia bannensis]|uniref:Helix-turn-helix transcriptional regulator n=1 Tax=Pseudonocardia bannensis TaxID=630973 RepID=A0A848DGW6_9PSEU|nr:helix-turn-helix transcriptional regulator [Pseudonocardia bannensis]NMH91789.1 helix-turn-helix transcriptional regulator [Pseudonocardia bannensis]
MTPDTRLQTARELRGFLRRSRRPATGPTGVLCTALETLHGVLPYDCAAFARWDPVACRHVTLAGIGYPAAVLRFLDTRMHADPLFAEVHRNGGPLRVRDIPRPRRRGEIFETVIEPLGFADGLTQCLFARDGRYLGMLNASTMDRRHPDDDAVALLDLLADDLAATLDPLPAAVPATGALADGRTEGILVTAAARTVALSGGARPELAAPGSPLRPLLDDLLAGREPPGALLVLLGTDLLAVSLCGGAHGVVVLHRTADPPFGLTPRELEVLDAVSRGRTNAETARALRVSPRTVATHVEHVLAKTGCPNRAAAARLATRLGLLVRGRPVRTPGSRCC